MKLFRNPGLLIILFIVILNPWWRVIIQRNEIAGILVFALSVIVYMYFWQVASRKLFFLLITLTAALFFIAVREAFDESIFVKSALDIQQNYKRHEFYAKGLGKLYTNRFSLAYFKDFNLPVYKLQRNFFANLDPNLYFFKSHPRERLGVEEYQKYLPLFLPFFLLGFLSSIYNMSVKLVIYAVIISLISSIISFNYKLGPILFFPIINFMIARGIILSLKRIKKK